MLNQLSCPGTPEIGISLNKNDHLVKGIPSICMATLLTVFPLLYIFLMHECQHIEKPALLFSEWINEKLTTQMENR